MYGKFIGNVYHPPNAKEEPLRNGKFTPFATMFKMTKVDSDLVECVSCGSVYQANDLLSGELNENHCPKCGTKSAEFWSGKPHRMVGV